MQNMPETMNSPLPDSPLISILVISYNTREMTLECLHSVVNETVDCSYELIVVDNNSQDGSAEAIEKEFPDIKLMALKDNLGFAKANNLAAEHASGEYVLLLNPDTVVLDKAIDRLMTFAKERPEAGIWGGRTYYGDKSLNPYSCWRRTTVWNLFCRVSGIAGVFSKSEFLNSEAYGGWQRDSVRQVDIVTGCFFLITKELWTDLKGFDPAFFMYGEEADLCLRAGKKGYSPMVTPNAGIIHYGGASDTVQEDKMVRLLKGKISLVKRHWSPLTRGLGAFLYLMWPVRQNIVRALLKIVSPREKFNEEAAKTWRQIWRRRNEWKNGY
ncbi:MAG: glycosyltransferase family 2 protein [Methyloligellaceae bacterium]